MAPAISIVPFNHDFATLERAVKERVFTVKRDGKFAPPPLPEADVFWSRLSQTRAQLIPLLPKTAPVSYAQFIDTYSGRKKARYQEALERMRCTSWNLKNEAAVSVFIKCEKTDRTTKSDPVPRVISPRSPLFNLRIGRYLKHMEEKVFHSLGGLFGHQTVLKGCDIYKSASLICEKWDMFNDPVAVGLDASRFDQHVSEVALRWEHEIYLQCFPRKKDRERLAKMLRYQLRNKCTGYAPDGVLKYTTEGGRMSGDMNTSLGNCVLMVSMIHAYGMHKGIRIHLANNGDDCVVFMEKRDLPVFSDGLYGWFEEMGFSMAIEAPAYQLEHIEFCQTRPVFDGSRWLMVRNPVTGIAKDSVMLHPWSGDNFFRGWLDSVGTGGLALTGGLPVFQSFYSSFIRAGLKRKVPEDMLSWSVRQSLKTVVPRAKVDVHPACRASFYWAFGITPDEQLCLEKYYDSLVLTPEKGVEYHSRSVF